MKVETKILRKSALAASAIGVLALVPFAQGHYHTDGLSNCNCTKNNAELQVCMARTIQIEVSPGKFITITTGFTEQNCATQSVPPGECIYYQYNSSCSYDWWNGWSCKLTSTSLKTRKATQADCFSSQ